MTSSLFHNKITYTYTHLLNVNKLEHVQPKKKKKKTKFEHIIFFSDKLEIDLYSKLNKISKLELYY